MLAGEKEKIETYINFAGAEGRKFAILCRAKKQKLSRLVCRLTNKDECSLVKQLVFPTKPNTDED